MTSKKVAELNSVLLADFHKLLKKYQAVRKIVRILTVSVLAFVIIFFRGQFRHKHLKTVKSSDQTVTELSHFIICQMTSENLIKYHQSGNSWVYPLAGIFISRL